MQKMEGSKSSSLQILDVKYPRFRLLKLVDCPMKVSVRRVIVPIPVVRVTRNIALNKLAWFYLTAVLALVPSLRLGSPSHLRVPS